VTATVAESQSGETRTLNYLTTERYECLLPGRMFGKRHQRSSLRGLVEQMCLTILSFSSRPWYLDCQSLRPLGRQIRRQAKRHGLPEKTMISPV
jgi:hypothetical protein